MRASHDLRRPCGGRHSSSRTWGTLTTPRWLSRLCWVATWWPVPWSVARLLNHLPKTGSLAKRVMLMLWDNLPRWWRWRYWSASEWTLSWKKSIFLHKDDIEYISWYWQLTFCHTGCWLSASYNRPKDCHQPEKPVVLFPCRNPPTLGVPCEWWSICWMENRWCGVGLK